MDEPASWATHEHDGAVYYHNERTGETTWECPPCLQQTPKKSSAGPAAMMSPPRGLVATPGKGSKIADVSVAALDQTLALFRGKPPVHEQLAQLGAVPPENLCPMLIPSCFAPRGEAPQTQAASG